MNYKGTIIEELPEVEIEAEDREEAEEKYNKMYEQGKIESEGFEIDFDDEDDVDNDEETKKIMTIDKKRTKAILKVLRRVSFEGNYKLFANESKIVEWKKIKNYDNEKIIRILIGKEKYPYFFGCVGHFYFFRLRQRTKTRYCCTYFN